MFFRNLLNEFPGYSSTICIVAIVISTHRSKVVETIRLIHDDSALTEFSNAFSPGERPIFIIGPS